MIAYCLPRSVRQSLKWYFRLRSPTYTVILESGVFFGASARAGKAQHAASSRAISKRFMTTPSNTKISPARTSGGDFFSLRNLPVSPRPALDRQRWGRPRGRLPPRTLITARRSRKSSKFNLPVSPDQRQAPETLHLCNRSQGLVLLCCFPFFYERWQPIFRSFQRRKSFVSNITETVFCLGAYR